MTLSIATVRLFLGIPLIALLGGCAISYQDADGNMNHIGLLWLKQNTDANRPVIVELTRLGAGIQLGNPSGLLLGWDQQVLISARDDDRVYQIDFQTADPFRTRLEIGKYAGTTCEATAPPPPAAP